MASEDADDVVAAFDAAFDETTQLLPREVVVDVGENVADSSVSADSEYYGTVDSEVEFKKGSKGKGGKKDKKEKAKKAVADMVKIQMASERTFFKWFRTGLQIGAIGTFVFIAFDKHGESYWRFVVVAFAWMIGLLLVLFGVYGYYHRRAVIRDGNSEEVADFEHSPVLVVAALVLVVGAGCSMPCLRARHHTRTEGVIQYITTSPTPSAQTPQTAQSYKYHPCSELCSAQLDHPMWRRTWQGRSDVHEHIFPVALGFVDTRRFLVGQSLFSPCAVLML